jgi:hypothetical protein
MAGMDMKASSGTKIIKELITSLQNAAYNPRVQRWLTLLALASIGLWMLWPCLKRDCFFAYDFDNEYMMASIFSHASNVLRSGHWPLWINTLVGGLPLYNSPQFCLSYPLYLIFLPIYQTSISAMHSIHYLTLLHILILEFNSYFFLRTLKLSRFSCLLGAVLLAFSANTLVYCKWGNAMPAYSWFLLYLGALVLLFRNPSIRTVLLTIFSSAMLVWASPAQPLILAIVTTIVFVGYQFTVSFGRRRLFFRSLAGLAAAGAIVLLLTAPILAPIYLEYGQMVRYVTNGPPVIGFGDISFKAFLVDQLSFTDFLGIVFPLNTEKEVGSQLLGPLTLTLAFFGLFSRRRESHTYFFVFLGGYALLSAAGANLGFAYINYHIPFVNMIREPSKFLFLFILAACVLAAIGFEHLRSRVSIKDKRFFSKWEHCAMAAILIIWVLTYFLGQEHFLSLKKVIRVSVVWGVLMVFLWAVGRTYNQRAIRYASIFALALAAINMNARLVRWEAPNIRSSHYLRSPSIRLHSVFRRLAAIDPLHDYRVLIEGTFHKQQAAMIGAFYGVRTFNVYFNPVPELNMRDFYYYESKPHKYFQALGAKYLICDDCSAEATNRYVFKEEVEGIKIYETKDVVPHYFLRDSIDSYYANITEYALKTTDLPLASGILAANRADIPLLGVNAPPDPKTQGCRLLEEERSPNGFAFAVNCSSPNVFILNENNSGQWRAWRNGMETRVFSVNWNQIGVPVPAGSSHIEIEYAPKNLSIAMYPFFAGLLILSGLIIYSIKKRNAAETAVEPDAS